MKNKRLPVPPKQSESSTPNIPAVPQRNSNTNFRQPFGGPQRPAQLGIQQEAYEVPDPGKPDSGLYTPMSEGQGTGMYQLLI